VIRYIFSTNSRLVINFLIITNFTTLIIYFGLLSISIVGVNQQMRGILTLDIVDVLPNLMDGKN